MPPASLRFIKAAWVWFAIGLALGGALALAKVGWVTGHLLAWRTAHVHALVVGWGAQWIFGIAFWIYPGRESERTDPRTDRQLLACWILLNGGTALRVTAEGALTIGTTLAGADVVFIVGAAAQITAGLWFAWLIQNRIRPARWIRRDLERSGAKPAPGKNAER